MKIRYKIYKAKNPHRKARALVDFERVLIVDEIIECKDGNDGDKKLQKLHPEITPNCLILHEKIS